MNCPPKILVVEPEQGAALQVRQTLEGLGYSHTEFAPTAAAALEAVRRERADIVLIDVKLPGDIDLADRIASEYGLPVLYLTAFPEPTVLDRLEASQFFGYLVKPVETNQLRAVLELAVESWRERRAAELPTVHSAQPEDIFDGIGEPLFTLSPDWRLTYVNNHAVAYFGHDRELLLGRVVTHLLPEDPRVDLQHEFYKTLSRNAPRAFEFRDEPKGLWFDVRAYPFREGLLIFFRDVTERKESQEQRSRLEKLEGLGLLARGFAHDFNNLLTVLLGNLSLASVKNPSEGDYEDALLSARQATLQAQNLVQQLLTFAKGGVPIKEPADLAALVREIVEARSRRAHIEYRVQRDKEPVPAEVDKSQFRRLLENLIQNAEEAMPAGGVVTIGVGYFDREHPPTSRLPHLDPNTRYVAVQVLDNGEGIPATNLDKIFEPYYSTRSDANATGIGLTVCDSIAKAHQGFLTVDSKYGEYANFTLFLPALVKRPETTLRVRSSRPLDPSAPRRVLILEDDRNIRMLISLALRKNGYVVHETEEGSQTVEAYRQAFEVGAPFDLVIMDLTIPDGMSGVEAIAQIRQFDPDVLAVVSSGYSDDPVMANHRDYGFAAVLPKPYEPSVLGKLVGDILRRSSEPNLEPSLT